MVKRLNSLSGRFAEDPISRVTCALFKTREHSDHWIELRHTGYNEGAGLVEWGSDEKDRFAARSGRRLPAGQIIDFVEKHGTLRADAQDSKRGIFTSLTRLLSTPEVRERLGIDLSQGTVVSLYPEEEVARGLSRIVDDLKTGALPVKAIYHAPDRIKFAKLLPRTALPRKTKKLKQPVTLEDLSAGVVTKAPVTSSKRSRRRRSTTRTTLIPRESQLDIGTPRIMFIYNELLSLDIESFPNAGSVCCSASF